ncbi:MAG: ABC transporter ATP-binding protein [Parcubacteria group bacterium]|nr:ABC transporter ATP-binding protein [Parcubacteria group bacterium]
MKLQNNPVVYLSSKMWKYSQGNRGSVVLYVLLFLLANGLSFLDPLIIAKIINILQERGLNEQSLPDLLFYLGVFFVLNLGFWCFHGPARIIERQNAFLVRFNYKKHLLGGVMAFPLEWHTDHHSGDTIDKVEKGTHALYDFSSDTFQIIENVISLTSSYLVLIYFNVHAGYIVLSMVALSAFLVGRFDKVLAGQYRRLYQVDNKISAKVFDTISNITTIIILRIERLVSSSLFKKMMEPFQLFMTNAKLNEVKWFLVSMCGTAMTVAVIGSYLYMHSGPGQVLMLGTVYALYGYLERIGQVFYRFTYMYGELVQRKSAVMNAEEISNDLRRRGKNTKVLLANDWREIRVKDLTFSYQSSQGNNLHLNHLSFSLHRGERIAFIGVSGSGKTTVLKVIRDLYHPKKGTILLDDVPLKNGFRDISSSLSLIPQDPEIFSTTIRENITVGVPYSADDIKRFTDMACFTSVVKRLPNGLASLIYEKGVNLSGGEKQRLALSRGLLASQDKAIILLDEPTSSVDSKNELQIYKNIFNAYKGKTVVSTIHRLHLLPLFDRIYIFKAGKIIGTGSFKELLETSKEFKKLWGQYEKVSRHSFKPVESLAVQSV